MMCSYANGKASLKIALCYCRTKAQWRVKISGSEEKNYILSSGTLLAVTTNDKTGIH